MKIKKSCNNCQDYMVCIAYGKEVTKVCEDWTISLEEFLKTFDKNKIPNINDL